MSARRYRYDEIGRQDESLRRRTTFDENNRRIDPVFGPELDTIISPASIPDLVGWYEARELSLSEGANVTSWADLSPNGNTLSLYGVGAAPTYNVVSGRPVVTLGSAVVGTGLRVAHTFPGGTGYTAALIGTKWTLPGGTGALFGPSDTAGVYGNGILLFGGIQRWGTIECGIATEAQGTNVLINDRRLIITTAQDNDSLTVYENGRQTARTTFSATLGCVGFLPYLAFEQLGVRVEAALYYTRRLTQVELAELTTYLATEFQLSIFAACSWPIEEHGGIAPAPAPPDALFLASGAALDASLQVARVPWYMRVPAVIGTAFAVRTTRCCGRPEGAHLLIVTGAIPVEALGLVLRGRP